jgi:hypothetical protein
MNSTDLSPLIRECVDGPTNPVTFREIRARAAMAERVVRREPERRRARFAVAGAGLAAAGIAGGLAATQIGGGVTAAGTQRTVTAAVIRQIATASQTAMNSGQAEVGTTTGGTTVVQDITFDGPNWNDVLNPGMPFTILKSSPKYVSWTGESIDRVVNGQSYHYPYVRFTPGQQPLNPRSTQEWMHITAPGAAAALNMPDLKTLLSVLSPTAGFVADGYTTINGVQARHMHATTPGSVSLTPLNPLIATEPDNPGLSALDVWVDSSGVVVKVELTVAGSGAAKQGQDVTISATFSQMGQPQQITVPANVVTPPGKRS